MNKIGRDERLHRYFRWAILLKGLDGLLELAGGLLLWVTSPAAIGAFVATLTQHELSTDPHDLVANWLLGATSHLTADGLAFGTVYLLAHGVVKVVLAVAVLREKHWAFPPMMAFLGVFILYQVYRVGLSHSLLLAALTAFDMVVLALVHREYRVLLRR